MAMSGQYGEEVRNTLGMLLRYRYDEVASGNVSPDHILAACLIGNHHLHVQAISIGAVFFGACTYIGNGPNFMVKSIAEHAGIECPTFVRYLVGYALPILVPIFLIVWLISFRT
jgi:Na+/H+ antiporter NhaD/arsenite permease-like protein